MRHKNPNVKLGEFKAKWLVVNEVIEGNGEPEPEVTTDLETLKLLNKFMRN